MIAYPIKSAYIPVVFLDIAKAYDRVWIDGLLYKLYSIGVTGHLFFFFKALLCNRSFQVVHSNVVSIVMRIIAGVPQGSVSGPDLFTIYIHGIRDLVVRACCLNKFADDMCIWPKIPGPNSPLYIQHAL